MKFYKKVLISIFSLLHVSRPHQRAAAAVAPAHRPRLVDIELDEEEMSYLSGGINK